MWTVIEGKETTRFLGAIVGETEKLGWPHRNNKNKTVLIFSA